MKFTTSIPNFIWVIFKTTVKLLTSVIDIAHVNFFEVMLIGLWFLVDFKDNSSDSFYLIKGN